MSDDKYILPLSVTQKIDISRLIRELNLVDDHLKQSSILKPDQKVQLKASTKLAELINLNHINYNDQEVRTSLINWLEKLKASAPVINISFSVEADEEVVSKITQWFRREISPNCLLVVGLIPSIGVGCVVRTNNKVFDMSLKNRLKTTHNLLISRIKQSKVQGNQVQA